MKQLSCPLCAKEIKPVEFGGGWVWVCCGKVVHSAARPENPKGLQKEAAPRTGEVEA